MTTSIKNNIPNVDSKLADKAEQTLTKTQDTIKKSGQDWRNYIKDHPFQAMLYGVVILYSVKGFLQPSK